MSGKRLLLDTNAIVALLQGNPELINLTADAEWLGISVISQIEFLCFTNLAAADRELFAQFVSRVEVIGLHPGEANVIEEIIKIRQSSRAKLPDAIVAGSAVSRDATLVTADRQLASIERLKTVSFQA